MKKLLITAALLAMTLPAMAQQTGPEKYTLTLTPQEVNAVGVALMQRPYAEVADLMKKLNEQVQAQGAALNQQTAPIPAPRPADAPKPPEAPKK